MKEYITSDGDVVDLICSRFYGDESGFVERVLNANYGLADRGAILPAGIKINLPEISTTPHLLTLSLWD